VPPTASPPPHGPNLSNPRRTDRPARSDKQRRIYSKTVGKVETLKHLIDETCDAFGRFSQETILRFYGQTFFLSQIFHPHKKITDLFNKVVKGALEAPYDVPDPVLIEFKPIATPQFWNKKERTIQGQSIQKIILDQNGRTQEKYLSVVLRFRDDETYNAMTNQIRGKKINNFLVFAEKASVDLEDCRRKQASINKGFSKKNNTFFLYVDIVSPDQFCEGWQVRGQRGFGEMGLFAKQDIPERVPKPVRA